MFVVSQQLEVAEACVWASYAPVAIVGVGTNTLSLFEQSPAFLALTKGWFGLIPCSTEQDTT